MTDPALPPRLSASALTTLTSRCKREFALRHKAGRYWPAPEGLGKGDAATDPRFGTAFHTLVQQHAMGLDVGPTILALASELPALSRAWDAYLASPHATPPSSARVWTEQELRLVVEGVPVSVRYDRLIRDGGAWTIIDWKTGHPNAEKLRKSWQARLYPYALVEAGGRLADGAPIKPTDVQVVFWDVSRSEPIEVPYDEATHQATAEDLRAAAREALAPFDEALADDPRFPRKPTHCPRCPYNDLCNRQFGAPPQPSPVATPVFVIPPAHRQA